MEIDIHKETDNLRDTVKTLLDITHTIGKTPIDELKGTWEINVSIKQKK